ncbi:membrane-bound lytic murein transglycosylase MltC, partial [Salmonella enterica subsp. enterica serovar Anatum]|nr:membrane-bound lytic murein transglycosylase MltC [Salmonella enterica subsp. enterica serovar Anatum]
DQIGRQVTVPDTVDRVVVLQHQTLNLLVQMNATDKIVGVMAKVVQHSAGKDVFRSQGKSGTPSRNFLFDPASNIDTGTAYLAM